jgi:hypothetical protein
MVESNYLRKEMREFKDEDGRPWRAIAVDAIVAHGRPGAALAFVPGDQPEAEPIPGGVTFNSDKAAEFALRTMGETELRRRLGLARATV